MNLLEFIERKMTGTWKYQKNEKQFVVYLESLKNFGIHICVMSPTPKGDSCQRVLGTLKSDVVT